jgi:hypothetical protein
MNSSEPVPEPTLTHHDSGQADNRDLVGRWTERLERIAADETMLRDQGQWSHGRADSMGVLGRHRDELAHSKMVAWLLDPCGKHGLGTRVLKRVVQHVLGLGPLPSDLARVRVRCEVPIGDAGRLDIEVESAGFYLIIENKVDAEEMPGQCRFYCDNVKRSDAHFILLSPDGRHAIDAAECVPLKYSALAGFLNEALQDASADAGGRRVAEDYLSTLRQEFR